ncbi:MAG: SIR2 family protein [Hyphomonadaceae bacterium]
MRTIALLGAGFSRNWGGWLANEAFEYLIGSRVLQRRRSVLDLLWKHQRRGGFEGALDELQTEFERGRNSGIGADLKLLNDAVRDMFTVMNGAFFNPSFNFPSQARDFLVNFDAIFSLNQDMLLERHYIRSGQFPSGGGPKKWSGATLPGIKWPFENAEQELSLWRNGRWTVQPGIPKLGIQPQPIFKLHGSAQWYRENDTSGLMVLGGGKSSMIEKDELLRWYWAQFRSELGKSGTRLMIIGYGFLDDHVNTVIRDAGTNSVKMFVIDPWGADVWVEGRGGQLQGRNHLQNYLMGASRRSMSEIIEPSSVEHAKVMRFFRD